MSDSDSINPFEAPKQATVFTEPTISDPILYEATPTIQDLNAALRPSSAIILPCMWLSLLMVIFLACSLNLIFSGLKNAGEIAILLILIFLISLVLSRLRSIFYATKTHLRLNPNATAPLTGELTSRGLKLKSKNRISWSSHDGLLYCGVKNDQLSLCHDPLGVVVRILPTRGFRNPDLARRFLESKASEVTEYNILEPLAGPNMVGEQPADAIAFNGVVTAGDLKSSPMEAMRNRIVKHQLIVMLVTAAVSLPLVALLLSWAATLMVIGAFFLLGVFVVSKLRSASKARESDLPLISIQGWLTEQEIALLHNVGQSRSGWQDFQSVGFNDACIWLQTYGGKNRFILLPRRLFSDDVLWQAAVDIAASQSTK